MTNTYDTDDLDTAANGRLHTALETRLKAEVADIDQQLADAYYSASITGRPVKPDWLHKALEARRHRANKLRDIGVDPGRPPRVGPGEWPVQAEGDGAGEAARLTREVERLTREVERLAAENERLTDELEAWEE